MKKALIGLIVLLVLTIAGVLYFLFGKTFEFRITAGEIQAGLNAKLPYTRSYFFVFEVTLDNPRVTLVDGSEKIKAGLDIVLNIHIGNEKKPLSGSVDVASGVRYDPETHQFFLIDPVIERLAVQGIPEKYEQKVGEALTKALSEYYQSHPVYTLKGTDLKQAAARLLLKKVVVIDQALVVTLGL
ncbi:MAG: DUF1439 domain-containing protein [Planctomycetota bacterium]